MSASGLATLYQLHRVDAKMHEIKARAGALDQGQAIAKELADLTAATQEVRDKWKAMHQEQRDLELSGKSLEDKVKKFQEQLFSGSVTNAREVEHLQKEVAMLKEMISKQEDRLLELMDESPPVEKEAKEAERQMAALANRLQERKEAAVKEHAELKAAYQQLAAKRPAMAAKVEKRLLDVYEPLKARHGTGMAIATPQHTCGTCGMEVARKSYEALKEDKLVACEGCRRILFIQVVEAGS